MSTARLFVSFHAVSAFLFPETAKRITVATVRWNTSYNVLYKVDVSEESAASTLIVEVKPHGGNTADIGTMRPGPAGKASFPCVYLNTTPRVGCGVTGVYGRSQHSKSRHYMEVSRQLHFPTTW